MLFSAACMQGAGRRHHLLTLLLHTAWCCGNLVQTRMESCPRHSALWEQLPALSPSLPSLPCHPHEQRTCNCSFSSSVIMQTNCLAAAKQVESPAKAIEQLLHLHLLPAQRQSRNSNPGERSHPPGLQLDDGNVWNFTAVVCLIWRKQEV